MWWCGVVVCGGVWYGVVCGVVGWGGVVCVVGCGVVWLAPVSSQCFDHSLNQ